MNENPKKEKDEMKAEHCEASAAGQPLLGDVDRLDVFNEVKEIMRIFPNSFINRHEELILNTKYNIYFRLEDVHSILDLKCKFIAWVSRPASKGTNKYWQPKIRKWFNEYLKTNFSHEEILEYVYTYLGNDVNRKLCEKFVISGYDITLLSDRDKRLSTSA